MNAYTQSEKNVRKTWLLMSMFFLFISAIGYYLSIIFKDENILYFFAIFSIGWIIISYFFSSKAALKLSGAKKVDKNNPKEVMVMRLVENLAISQGMKTPKVFIINDEAMNAFATGRKQEDATIVFTKGLLESLDKKELEGVAAHELSHIKNKDIMIMTLVVVLIGLIAIISDMVIRMVFFSQEKKSPQLIILAIVLGVLSPIVSKVIQLAISRKREFLADSSAVLMTRFPKGLASALEKISSQGVAMKKQHTATAHLFISNPQGKKKGFFTKIFSTHPPVEERIDALKQMGQ